MLTRANYIGLEELQKIRFYCEPIKKTNGGSCVLMKVQRPLLERTTKFHRFYFSLAAIKRCFLASCRPIIRLDGCFRNGLIRDNSCMPFRGKGIITCIQWPL
jgi:hypothetical protein